MNYFDYFCIMEFFSVDTKCITKAQKGKFLSAFEKVRAIPKLKEKTSYKELLEKGSIVSVKENNGKYVYVHKNGVEIKVPKLIYKCVNLIDVDKKDLSKILLYKKAKAKNIENAGGQYDFERYDLRTEKLQNFKGVNKTKIQDIKMEDKKTTIIEKYATKMARDISNGKKGGMLEGKSHKECDENGCGIKAVVTDQGNTPVELESREVIINKKSVESNNKHTFDGEEMTNKEVLNAINTENGNGVPVMECGGEVMGKGGSVEGLYEINSYRVFIGYEDYNDEIYAGDDREKAENELFALENSDNEYGNISVMAFLEKKTDKYKFIGELDEDEYEVIEDYPVEDYFEDRDYYDLIEEEEWKVIDEKELSGSEGTSSNLSEEVQDFLKETYGRKIGSYSHINLGANEENEDLSMTIRVKDHSENPSNRIGESAYLSVVIANKDATAQRWNSGKELYFTGEDSLDDIKEGVFGYIQDVTETEGIVELSEELENAGHTSGITFKKGGEINPKELSRGIEVEKVAQEIELMGMIEDFQKIYEENKNTKTANDLSTAYYVYFNEIVKQDPSKLKDLLDVSEKATTERGRFNLSWIVLNEDFESLENNLWDYLPEVKLKKVKAVPYSLDAKSKGLGKITKPFTADDDFRPMLVTSHFDEQGVVCTDAYKLLFLKGKTKEQGDYCTTKQCIEVVNNDHTCKEEGLKVECKNSTYPNWKALIPSVSSSIAYSVDIDSVRLYIKTLSRHNVFNNILELIVLRYGEEEIVFKASFLLTCLETMKMLGYSKVDFLFSTPSRASIIVPHGNKDKMPENWETTFGTSFCLLMPMELPDQAFKGVPYFNLDNESVGTYGISEDKEISLNPSDVKLRKSLEKPNEEVNKAKKELREFKDSIKAEKAEKAKEEKRLLAIEEEEKLRIEAEAQRAKDQKALEDLEKENQAIRIQNLAKQKEDKRLAEEKRLEDELINKAKKKENLKASIPKRVLALNATLKLTEDESKKASIQKRIKALEASKQFCMGGNI